MVDDGIRPATVVFDQGVITAVDASGPADRDFGDLVIMPGLVDSHVHVNDPGRADWEGFATATRAAAAGGTTTIVDMPLNSIPPTTSVAALEEKRGAATGRLSVDVAFWGGLVPGSAPELGPLARAGVCGFKAFLVDSGVPEFPPVTTDYLGAGLEQMARLGLPALVHAEDPGYLAEPSGDPGAYRTYLESRPSEAETRAVAMLARLAERSGAHVHVLHLASAEAVESLVAAGLSGETCPHYLTFAAEEIPQGATEFKCAPPIRERRHREGLWEALGSGRLDMVVSDHSPAPPRLKATDSGDFVRAWGGISSLQLRLPVVWHGAAARGLPLEALGDWLAGSPARLAGLDDRKGAIAPGLDADFVIWDPDGVTDVDGGLLAHRHALTPYQGMRLRGRVEATILRGHDVFTDDTVHSGRGRMLRRR